MNGYALPGLDNFLSRAYDDAPEPVEPTPEDFDEAFERCVDDAELLSEYIFDSSAAHPDGDPVSLLQMMWAGLPRPNDRSVSADARRDKYEARMHVFFDGYRDWLGTRLASMAQKVADERFEQDRWENRYVR